MTPAIERLKLALDDLDEYDHSLDEHAPVCIISDNCMNELYIPLATSSVRLTLADLRIIVKEATS